MAGVITSCTFSMAVDSKSTGAYGFTTKFVDGDKSELSETPLLCSPPQSGAFSDLLLLDVYSQNGSCGEDPENIFKRLFGGSNITELKRVREKFSGFKEEFRTEFLKRKFLSLSQAAEETPLSSSTISPSISAQKGPQFPTPLLSAVTPLGCAALSKKKSLAVDNDEETPGPSPTISPSVSAQKGPQFSTPPLSAVTSFCFESLSKKTFQSLSTSAKETPSSSSAVASGIFEQQGLQVPTLPVLSAISSSVDKRAISQPSTVCALVTASEYSESESSRLSDSFFKGRKEGDSSSQSSYVKRGTVLQESDVFHRLFQTVLVLDLKDTHKAYFNAELIEKAETAFCDFLKDLLSEKVTKKLPSLTLDSPVLERSKDVTRKTKEKKENMTGSLLDSSVGSSNGRAGWRLLTQHIPIDYIFCEGRAKARVFTTLSEDQRLFFVKEPSLFCQYMEPYIVSAKLGYTVEGMNLTDCFIPISQSAQDEGAFLPRKRISTWYPESYREIYGRNGLIPKEFAKVFSDITFEEDEDNKISVTTIDMTSSSPLRTCEDNEPPMMTRN